MASIIRDKRTGRRAIQVCLPEDRRPTVRLGKCTLLAARTACGHVEALAAALETGSAIPKPTAEWVASVSPTIRCRLERAGLVAPSARAAVPTLGEWLDRYIGGRGDVKPATATVYGHTKRNLLAFFGADKPLDSFTPGEGDAFAVYLRTAADTNGKKPKGLSDNTVRRRLGIAKQFYRAAVRRKLVSANPFDGQVTTVRDNPRRRYFVTREETEAVLNALPDARWRLAFALARYGGLRCPSEVARLTWADVSWDRMRFTVHAAKTEHHADAGIRAVPIFPELLPYFREAFEAAEDGEVYCCPQYSANIVAQMYRKVTLQALALAGMEPWPKLFQNMRATRETELAEQFPVQVVCQWIGNSPAVAARHYLQVTDEHFARATGERQRSDAESDAAENETGPHGCAVEGATTGESDFLTPAHATSQPCNPADMYLVGDTGLEPVTSCLSSKRSSQLS